MTVAPNARALRAHVLELAAELGVRVHECAALHASVDSGHGPCAHVAQRVVDTSPVFDLCSYWTALHELGHVAWRTPGGLLSEARAWSWALDHAIVELDERARAVILGAWDAHVRHEGGDPAGGGCELVAAEHLAEYLQSWLRVVAALPPGGYMMNWHHKPEDRLLRGAVTGSPPPPLGRP